VLLVRPIEFLEDQAGLKFGTCFGELSHLVGLVRLCTITKHVEGEGSGTPDDLSNQVQDVRLHHKLADTFDASEVLFGSSTRNAQSLQGSGGIGIDDVAAGGDEASIVILTTGHQNDSTEGTDQIRIAVIEPGLGRNPAGVRRKEGALAGGRRRRLRSSSGSATTGVPAGMATV
jgi:hypothetical protein